MQKLITSVILVGSVIMAEPLMVLSQQPTLPGSAAQPSLPAASSVHKPVLPLPPAELLDLLPKTPDKWELKQSQGNNFIMDWVSSQASREFSYTPPPTAPSGDIPPLPPLILRVAITDTGYYQGLMGDFETPVAARTVGVETLTLSGFPARLISLGKMGQRLRVLVKNRYVVQIDVENQPANSAQQWWRIIDSSRLANLPVDGEEKLPRPFSITRIDELNPRNNSVSKVSWATQEEADSTARRR